MIVPHSSSFNVYQKVTKKWCGKFGKNIGILIFYQITNGYQNNVNVNDNVNVYKVFCTVYKIT